METELKLLLDPGADAALAARPILAEPGTVRGRERLVVTTYFDTAARDLARAGIALRLRRDGRQRLQSLKRAAGPLVAGLSMPEEEERPVRGDQPDLAAPEGPLARTAAAIVGTAPLGPVFETRVRRRTWILRPTGGGAVEVALDRGEIAAGDRCLPVAEAEIELKEGPPGAVWAAAAALFPTGPVRFATATKAERGRALAETGEDAAPPDPPLPVPKAGQPVETVARDAFRYCLGQIAANLARAGTTAAPEGPHQLRVALRRLRAALALLAPCLGGVPPGPMAAEARWLGQVAGSLRDLDVLAGRLVPDGLALADPEARAALLAAVEVQRAETRAQVQATLLSPRATRFVFDLGGWTEARGWLDPADWGQSARLATPIADLAPALLDHRLERALKRGRHVRHLTEDARHTLRKELKKLRYAAEFLAGLWPGKRTDAFLKALRQLQDTFGELTDVAMARDFLLGPDAPGRDDPAAQRGTGFLLGALAVRVEARLPDFARRWEGFREARPFWHAPVSG